MNKSNQMLDRKTTKPVDKNFKCKSAALYGDLITSSDTNCNNAYQDYLEETKKSDNVAMAAALSKAALNSAYGAAIKLESMSHDHPLKEIGKEVEIYVTRKKQRGALNYVR